MGGWVGGGGAGVFGGCVQDFTMVGIDGAVHILVPGGERREVHVADAPLYVVFVVIVVGGIETIAIIVFHYDCVVVVVVAVVVCIIPPIHHLNNELNSEL